MVKNLIDYKNIGLKVGLEIHQQLATKNKLFCHCEKFQSDEFEFSFNRRLRPTQSEMGQVDPAAMFEFKKGKVINYHANRGSSCLVEADEEPPHDLNMEAVESALIVALALRSNIVDELHTMRKIVIDGSNTTGFQRTIIVALGGLLKTKNRDVPVQTICLEEDAARLVGDHDVYREYYLDRLCVPLVEIALAPVEGSPEEIQEIALSLGRLLRATRRVARGLGTIRQDVNISIKGGKVVEVKGIQKLDLISKIIEFEALRQKGLMEIKSELEKIGVKSEDIGSPLDVTKIFKDTECELIEKAVEKDGIVLAVRLKGFSGLLEYEPYPDIRLGKEMAELVRFYGLGGIFHSDELPSYGIKMNEIDSLKKLLEISNKDAFILLAGPKDNIFDAMMALIERAKDALQGVPYETRGPTPDSKTRFIRPRPGPARMYPETDMPPIPITKELLLKLEKEVPKPWEEQIEDYVSKYGLSYKLALKVFDSEYSEIFEIITSKTKIQPSFIAATLTETLVSLSRAGFDINRLDENDLIELFLRLDEGRISKEALPQVLEVLLKGEARRIEDAIKKLGIVTISEDELSQIVEKIVQESKELIKERGERSFSILMGKVMNIVRGRVDGAKVGAILKKRIENVIKE
ncbi:MAG: Glu-tRNA(Gln) amidotransferase subunit GatE [archaeon]|nr:Glu-tRNA(Gln) amidotransferase subunit GatE [archaeon]MCP8314216.1 Glu-tRNA(Gln) amidotransferase subunit GatE [archaeon]